MKTSENTPKNTHNERVKSFEEKIHNYEEMEKLPYVSSEGMDSLKDLINDQKRQLKDENDAEDIINKKKRK